MQHSDFRPQGATWLRALLSALTAVCLAAVLTGTAGAASLLDTVKARGRLVCGVNTNLPGFAAVGSNGQWIGFDVDFCRAIAAAVLGDARSVEFVPLTAAQRFTALQTGEIDVLIRNTTHTLARDTELGLDFGPPTFYDGQGFMVRRDLGVQTLRDLDGATICVQAGTTTELNLTDTFRAMQLDFTPVVFENIDTTYNAYLQGRCDAVTSDKSQLAARRAAFERPDDHVILEATISKEPLAPSTIHGDDQWADVVRWVVYATFYAEEVGITSKNVRQFLDSDNPEIQRFLGRSGNLGAALGLRADWAVRVIESVGNYGEIFERSLQVLGLPRGLNKPWTDGGLLYAMPFR
ncbi:MAG TPA: amino acid ABC transporter substrate-binding protein [Limnochordia bacterium]